MVTKKQIGVTIDIKLLERFKKKIYKIEQISPMIEFLIQYFCDKMDEGGEGEQKE